MICFSVCVCVCVCVLCLYCRAKWGFRVAGYQILTDKSHKHTHPCGYTCSCTWPVLPLYLVFEFSLSDLKQSKGFFFMLKHLSIFHPKEYFIIFRMHHLPLVVSCPYNKQEAPKVTLTSSTPQVVSYDNCISIRCVYHINNDKN